MWPPDMPWGDVVASMTAFLGTDFGTGWVMMSLALGLAVLVMRAARSAAD